MGNPAWVKGGASPNPSGRPKVADEFRNRARKAVDDHVIEKWIAEVAAQGENWVKCSELLAAYGYGKPIQGVELGGSGGSKELENLVEKFQRLPKTEQDEVAAVLEAGAKSE